MGSVNRKDPVQSSLTGPHEVTELPSDDLPAVPTYSRSFEDEKAEILALVTQWSELGMESVPDFDSFESIVTIKNSDRKITIENRGYRELCEAQDAQLQASPERNLEPHLARVSLETDRLLLDGVSSLEIEHLGIWYQGRPCTMVTYKRRLFELKSPQYAILTISRIRELLRDSSTERQRTLGELLALLQQLDPVDRTICQGYAMGDSTKEIAARVGLTTRAVELRRQKIMELFGFERPIEIVKMLVRLEENGLITTR